MFSFHLNQLSDDYPLILGLTIFLRLGQLGVFVHWDFVKEQRAGLHNSLCREANLPR